MGEDAKTFDGVWPGKVVLTDEENPVNKRAAAIKVSIPDIYGANIPVNDLPWAYPILPMAFDKTTGMGFFLMPTVGSFVHVLFERGDPQSPRWLGGWVQQGRIPFPFWNYKGDKYPHVMALRGPDKMMLRFIPGELLEIEVGESGEFINDVWTPDGLQKEHENFIRFDKRRKLLQVRCSYDVDIRCKGKIKISTTQIVTRIMPNQLVDPVTGQPYDDPASAPPLWQVTVVDPATPQGAKIMMKPGTLQGRAKQVKGFKDS